MALKLDRYHFFDRLLSFTNLTLSTRTSKLYTYNDNNNNNTNGQIFIKLDLIRISVYFLRFCVCFIVFNNYVGCYMRNWHGIRLFRNWTLTDKSMFVVWTQAAREMYLKLDKCWVWREHWTSEKKANKLAWLLEPQKWVCERNYWALIDALGVSFSPFQSRFFFSFSTFIKNHS